MRFNISQYSLARGSVVWFMLAVMLLGGIYAFLNLGKREDSTFTIKSAIVVCRYPGATPEEVESLVAEPLEREIRTLSSVDEISSESHFGYARLLVELHPATPTTLIAQRWDELRRKLEGARLRLPEGVTEISVADDFGDVYGLYYALVSEGGYSWDEMREYARTVQSRIYAIDGVEKVMLSGEQSPELNIYFSPATLSAFELRPEDIGRAISEQNVVAGLGVRTAGDVEVELTEGSTYASLSDIENQLLMAADGKQYRIGDVARVERGYRTPPSYILRVNGMRSIGIAVATNPERDVVAVGDAVSRTIEEVSHLLPAGLEVVALYPENEIAREATNAFLANLFESVAIVILLVMVAMGWRSGVVVGASLIFSIGGTLLAMLLLDEGLNRTSLAGFIIAMGMLVDNAIVVVDNTSQLTLEGFTLRHAAVVGATRPRMGLLAATLIAIISFLPLQLAPSSVAEIIRPLFRVIALALLLSWVLALTQVPLMSVKLLRPTAMPVRQPLGWFVHLLCTALRHRIATLMLVLMLFVASLVAMAYMPQNFFPQLSKPYFRADVLLAEGYDIEATERALERMSSYLLSEREVKRVSTTAGGTPPRYYLASGSYAERPNYGNILVELHSEADTEAVEERFARWVADSMPDVWLRSSLFRLSPVPEATLEFGFVGESIDTLSRLTAAAMAIMRERDDVVNVRNSWGNGVAVWEPRYSQLKAQRIGVERSSMIASLEMSTSGLRLATYREGDNAMPILLRVDPPADSTLTALVTMPVFSRRGASYTMEQAVAGFDFGFRTPVVRRIDGERVMMAQCDPARGVNAIALLDELRTEIERSITLPEGYRMELYGEQESRDKSNSALAEPLPLTLLLIFSLLLLLFGNLREPLIVLVTVPLIFIGVVAGLALTGKMFDFFSLLGLLGLVGMNIKSGVILLSRIDELRRGGTPAREALLEAARDRFIPVVAASATTVLGMLPLLFDSMFGSMAATIMGGLVVATLLVLVVLPLLYSLFYKI